MSEQVVFSQLSRKFIDENDATPAEAQQVVYYSLAIGHHLGLSIVWRPHSPAHGMSIWRGSPPWKPVAMPGVKWKACRSMARSSSISTMFKCWRARLMRRAPRRPRSSKNGAN